MTLQMTMTFGDLVVAGGTICAIVIAYYAIKSALASIATTQGDHTRQLSEHDDLLVEHGENLAALDAAVFGRRRHDAAVNRERGDRGKRRPIIEGST